VVGVAPGGGAVAALGGAAALFDVQGDALGLAVEAAFAAHVQHHGAAVDQPPVDRGDHPGLTREAAGEAGGDALAGVEVGGAQPGQQLVVVEEDHHGGVHPTHAGQPGRVQAIEEPAERLPEHLRTRPPPGGPGMVRAGRGGRSPVHTPGGTSTWVG
jgi:hypothetical protein